MIVEGNWRKIALGSLVLNAIIAAALFNSRRRRRRKQPPGSKPVRIYLLRHAQTTNNIRSADKMDGVSSKALRKPDPELTKLGEQQSEAVAEFFRNNLGTHVIKNVYCSPMRKTLETLRPIAHMLGGKMKFKLDMQLFERGGVFNGERSATNAERAALPMESGLSWSKMLEIVPSLEFQDIEDPHYFCRNRPWGVDKHDTGWYDGRMETQKEFIARAHRVADWLYTLKETSLVVTHGKFLDTLLKCLLLTSVDKEAESSWNYLHGACGLTILELNASRTAILAINQSTLPRKIVTGHSMSGFVCRSVDIRGIVRGETRQL